MLLCLSCRHSEPSKVWVDIDSVFRSQVVNTNVPGMPLPTRLPAKTIILPAKQAETLYGPANEGGASVTDEILEAQRKASQSLTRQLLSFYDRLAQKFAKDERKRLGDTYRSAYESVNPQIRQRFEIYAEARCPVMIRLAFLVGWPDPDPDSLLKPDESTRPVAVQRLNEAKQLRDKLRNFDLDYKKDVQSLLDKAESEANQEQTEALLRIAKMADELRAQAIKEAESQVKLKPAELGLRMTSNEPISFPAIPEKKIVLPESEKLPAPPKVQSRMWSLSPEGRLELLNKQLLIWSKVNGYELAKRRSDGRDATKEFIRWRKNLKLGP